jgi:DEAD/DEAH box helicase domain-containing protein
MVVGYNLFDFDMKVIANYLGEEIYELPQLDIMVAIQKKLGYRPKLDDVTSATFGTGKIGKGTDALRYWAGGELEKLREYCMEDVRLTKKLYDHGLENGTVKLYTKAGFTTDVPVEWDLGKRVPEEKAETISMF